MSDKSNNKNNGKVSASHSFYEQPAIMRHRRMIAGIAHWVVLVLSLALIVFISYDTFSDILFLENHTYMTFQLWVCIIFLLDFFLEWAMAENKKKYLSTHFCFFLISIPYLNIISLYHIQFSHEVLYFIRFIPLVRGAYSLAMVVGYFSSNKAMNLIASYAAILLSIIYFASLIFYDQEKSVNSDVTDYWSALWWACMNVTTIGCYINPLTIAGKVSAVVLAASGMMMLPLFTVYVTQLVKDYNDRNRRIEAMLHKAFDSRKKTNTDTTSPSTVATAPPQ